jgi:lysozyme
VNLKTKLLALGAAGFLAIAGSFLGPIESGPRGPQLTPYSDIGGVKTWCYGETAGAPKARYTEAECNAVLVQSMQKHWAGIEHAVPANAPPSVKAAMLSVAYNVGVRGFLTERYSSGTGSSRMVQALARQDWEGACASITAPWHGKHGIALGFKATVKGKPIRGLENRRKAEGAMCRQDLR